MREHIFFFFKTKLMIIIILKLCMYMMSRTMTLVSPRDLKGTVSINQYVPYSKDHCSSNPHFHAYVF